MSLREVIEELKNYPDEKEVAINARDLREIGAKIDAKIPEGRPVKVLLGTVRELVKQNPEPIDTP